MQRVVDAQGGEITDETTETDSEGDTSYVRMVVRVPSRKFGETMSALEQVGVLRSSDRGSDDVTTQVIDNGARVRAQEASLRRVELLLADARDLKDVIWIESQLTGRQAELDSLKSQQSWLADQTSLSTITVDISTHQVVEDEPEEERPTGFLAGLDGGSKAMGTLFTIVTTMVGALLPFAAVAAGARAAGLARRTTSPDRRVADAGRVDARTLTRPTPAAPGVGRESGRGFCPRVYASASVHPQAGTRSGTGSSVGSALSSPRPRVSGRNRAQISEIAATATL